MRFLARVLYLVSVLAFALAVALTANFLIIPHHNIDADHFDTLIVLGYPTNPDGTPSPEQRERVLEAVREYKADVAPHIILSGAAAHNAFIEAHSMAQLAATQGVPASALIEEPQAHNTIQNLLYSAEILRAHGWATAEIVSSPSHLPRAAILTDDLNRQHPDLAFNWRTHAAHWPAEYSVSRIAVLYAYEAWSALKLRFEPPQIKLPAASH